MLFFFKGDEHPGVIVPIKRKKGRRKIDDPFSSCAQHGASLRGEGPPTILCSGNCQPTTRVSSLRGGGESEGGPRRNPGPTDRKHIVGITVRARVRRRPKPYTARGVIYDNLIEDVLEDENIKRALERVVGNKGFPASIGCRCSNHNPPRPRWDHGSILRLH